MRDRRRRVDPIWQVGAGTFLTPSWALLDVGAEFLRICAVLRSADFLQGCSVWIRGSLLEELEPHPKSDIDLMVVTLKANTEEIQQQLQMLLQPFNRPVEGIVVSPDELEDLWHLQWLIRYRSYLVRGVDFLQPKVVVDARFIKRLGHFYRPLFVPHILEGPVRNRLVAVKYLLRTIGVLGLQDGMYTRDVRTCLVWSEKYVSDSAVMLHTIFADLEKDNPTPISVVPLINNLEDALDHLYRVTAE